MEPIVTCYSLCIADSLTLHWSLLVQARKTQFPHRLTVTVWISILITLPLLENYACQTRGKVLNLSEVVCDIVMWSFLSFLIYKWRVMLSKFLAFWQNNDDVWHFIVGTFCVMSFYQSLQTVLITLDSASLAYIIFSVGSILYQRWKKLHHL